MRILAILVMVIGCQSTHSLVDKPADPPASISPASISPATASPAILQTSFQTEGQDGESLPLATPQNSRSAGQESTPKAEESSAATRLTLPMLESIALSNSPAVAEAVAKVAVARGNWVQVGLPPNLNVGYGGNEIGNDGAAGQQGGYLSQQFVTGSKLRLNREVAAWQLRKAQNQCAQMRLRVLTDVRTSYYEVLIAQQRRDLAEELVRIGKQGVEATKALYRAEEVSEADPVRAQVEADSAEIYLQNAKNQQVQAWRRLSSVMGTPGMEPERLEGTLDAEQIEITWQETLSEVLAESPEMAAAMAEIESANWAVQRAMAQVSPDITVQGGAAYDDATSDTISNIQVQMAIPLWNRNQGGIRQAQAGSVAARRAADRLALDLTSRLAGAFQRYESARNQVQKYSGKQGILSHAERSLVLIRSGYQAEEFGVIDLISAQRTFFQTNLAYLDSLRDLWLAAIEIEGRLLDGSLSASIDS